MIEPSSAPERTGNDPAVASGRGGTRPAGGFGALLDVARASATGRLPPGTGSPGADAASDPPGSPPRPNGEPDPIGRPRVDKHPAPPAKRVGPTATSLPPTPTAGEPAASGTPRDAQGLSGVRHEPVAAGVDATPEPHPATSGPPRPPTTGGVGLAGRRSGTETALDARSSSGPHSPALSGDTSASGADTDSSTSTSSGDPHARDIGSPRDPLPSTLREPPASPDSGGPRAGDAQEPLRLGDRSSLDAPGTNRAHPVAGLAAPVGRPAPSGGQRAPAPSPGSTPLLAEQTQPVQAPPALFGRPGAGDPSAQVGRAVSDYVQTLSPAVRAPGGAWRIVVRLDPPELGNVDATLNLGPDGLHVELVASTPDAAQSLQASAHQLSFSLGATVTVSHSGAASPGGFGGSAPGSGGGAGNPGDPGGSPQHRMFEDPAPVAANQLADDPGGRGEILVRA